METNKLGVMEYLDRDVVACCYEGVMACLDEGVVTCLDKNNKYAFDADFFFAHPLQ